MGFMDSFTSDSPVELKQPDYYKLVREAAKGELLLNGIKARVPAEYLEAITTGKKIEVPAEYLEAITTGKKNEREVEENAGNTENAG